jgi:hypothetical protein
MILGRPIAIVFVMENLYIYIGVSYIGIAFLMAQSDSWKRFLTDSTGCAI